MAAGNLSDLTLVSLVAVVALLSTVAADALIVPPPQPPGASAAGPPAPVQAPTQTVIEQKVLANGHTDEGATTTENIGVPPNFTFMAVSVNLSWSDDYGSNDDFRIVLKVNGTVVDSAEGTSGTLSVGTDPGGGAPLSGSISVDITAVNCPGLVPGLPFDRDGGNDWRLEAVFTVRAG